MLRNILAAGLLALGTAGTALAQEGPALIGGGEDAQVVYNGVPHGSVVGGGYVRLNGGGEDRSYSYGPVSAQPGLVGKLIGGGDNAVVVYAPMAPATPAHGFARAPASDFQG